MRAIPYEQDLIIWANQQARWLRAKCFDLLDIEHLADEIEDVGKSAKQEFSQRMALLIADLLKWELIPELRNLSMQIIIRNQRRALSRILTNTPSLKNEFDNPDWWEIIWDDAIIHIARETSLDNFPEICPWGVKELLKDNWFPGDVESRGNK